MLPKSLGCKNLKVWKCISSGIKLNKLRGLSENAVGVSRPSSVRWTSLYFLVCTSPYSIVLDTSSVQMVMDILSRIARWSIWQCVWKERIVRIVGLKIVWSSGETSSLQKYINNSLFKDYSPRTITIDKQNKLKVNSIQPYCTTFCERNSVKLFTLVMKTMQNRFACVQELLQVIIVCTAKASGLLAGNRHPRVQDYSCEYLRYSTVIEALQVFSLVVP